VGIDGDIASIPASISCSCGGRYLTIAEQQQEAPDIQGNISTPPDRVSAVMLP
jgi:hypothetical protein